MSANDRIGPLTSVLLFTSAERFPAMRAFYAETLGLEAGAGHGQEQRVAFSWGAPLLLLRLILSVHDRVEGAAGDPFRVLLNLQVDDIHAVAARLGAAGVEFTRAPSQESWGGWIATFSDPDGNLLQLLQPTP